MNTNYEFQLIADVGYGLEYGVDLDRGSQKQSMSLVMLSLLLLNIACNQTNIIVSVQ